MTTKQKEQLRDYYIARWLALWTKVKRLKSIKNQNWDTNLSFNGRRAKLSHEECLMQLEAMMDKVKKLKSL